MSQVSNCFFFYSVIVGLQISCTTPQKSPILRLPISSANNTHLLKLFFVGQCTKFASQGVPPNTPSLGRPSEVLMAPSEVRPALPLPPECEISSMSSSELFILCMGNSFMYERSSPSSTFKAGNDRTSEHRLCLLIGQRSIPGSRGQNYGM